MHLSLLPQRARMCSDMIEMLPVDLDGKGNLYFQGNSWRISAGGDPGRRPALHQSLSEPAGTKPGACSCPGMRKLCGPQNAPSATAKCSRFSNETLTLPRGIPVEPQPLALRTGILFHSGQRTGGQNDPLPEFRSWFNVSFSSLPPFCLPPACCLKRRTR